MAAMKIGAHIPRELADAKGSDVDPVLKELWLCVLTCLVVIWQTGRGVVFLSPTSEHSQEEQVPKTNRICPKHLKANMLSTVTRKRDNKWARHLTDIKGWEERSQTEIKEKIRAPKSSSTYQGIWKAIPMPKTGHMLRKDNNHQLFHL